MLYSEDHIQTSYFRNIFRQSDYVRPELRLIAAAIALSNVLLICEEVCSTVD
jgi:hypothetical protein